MCSEHRAANLSNHGKALTFLINWALRVTSDDGPTGLKSFWKGRCLLLRKFEEGTLLTIEPPAVRPDIA